MLPLTGRAALIQAFAWILVGVLLAFVPASVAYANHNYDNYVTDDAGPDDQPGQKDLNSLAIDDSHVASENTLWLKWTWDVDSVSGGNTADGCAVFDSDGDGFANYMLCVTWGGNQLQQAGSPLLYVCNDLDADNCGGSAPTQPLSASTTCSLNNVPDAFGSRSGA
ncbi:MAG TPA: hypothetical protein PKE45_16695, partial [Caldilineaceae bacterium]|nr:hypothetical protein [Caldilineaceae bacterium]